MKKFVRSILLLQTAVALSALAMTSCLKVDHRYDLDKIDKGNPHINDVAIPLFDKTIQRKMALWEYQDLNLTGSPITSWGDLKDVEPAKVDGEWSLEGTEIDDEMKDLIKKLSGEDDLEIVFSTRTSLNFDMAAKIRFYDLFTGKDTDEVIVKGGADKDYTVTVLKLTQELINFILNDAEGYKPVLTNLSVEKITITENDWVQIGVGNRKKGGIGLDELK